MKNLLFITALLIIPFIYSCSKEEANDLNGNNAARITTSLTGRVIDENGIAISGATVIAGGKTATTDIWGIYYIENVSLIKSRDLLRVSSPGKWDQVIGFIPSTSYLTYVNIGMNPQTGAQTINGQNGGMITLPGNATIQFPPNGFVSIAGVPYNGSVAVNAFQLSPDAPQFYERAPGGDFKGVKTNGDETLLLSYGMVGVKLFDNSGNELKLAPGKMAEITFPIIPNFQSAAPASLPMWHLDEEKSLWMEEGVAVRNGNQYIGQVSHFSVWNFDDNRPFFTINGTVNNCSGLPQSNIYVSVHSLSPNMGGHGLTDANGNFSGMAPANENLNVYVGNWYNSSPYLTLPPQSTGSIFTLPSPLINLTPPCLASCTGTVLNCNGQPKVARILFLDSLDRYQGHVLTKGDGTFQYSLLPGKVKIISVNGQFYNTIDTGLYISQLYNLGQIYLCDTINVNNNFQLSFISQLGTVPFSFEVNNCNIITTSGLSDMAISYTDSATNTASDFHIITPVYLPGTYSWNATSSTIQGEVNYNGSTYTILPDSGTGANTFIITPPAGGNISGSFNGAIKLSGPGGLLIPGMLTGSFNILRNN